jgi:hypothetical protein
MSNLPIMMLLLIRAGLDLIYTFMFKFCI